MDCFTPIARAWTLKELPRGFRVEEAALWPEKLGIFWFPEGNRPAIPERGLALIKAVIKAKTASR